MFDRCGSCRPRWRSFSLRGPRRERRSFEAIAIGSGGRSEQRRESLRPFVRFLARRWRLAGDGSSVDKINQKNAANVCFAWSLTTDGCQTHPHHALHLRPLRVGTSRY